MRWIIIIAIVVCVSYVLFAAFFFVFGGDDEILENLTKELDDNTVGEVVNVIELEEGAGVSNKTFVSDGALSFRELSLDLKSKSEEISLSTSDRRLNRDESVVDVFGRYATSQNLPIFLGRDINETLDYVQTLRFPDTFLFNRFSNDDHLDGNRTYGVDFLNNEVIFDYSIDFGEDYSWDDIVGKTVFLFGRSHYVVSSDFNSNSIDFFEFPYSFDVYKNETVGLSSPFFNQTNFSIDLITGGKVVLKVNGERIKDLQEGQIYRGDNFVFYLDKIIFSSAEDDRVKIVIAPEEVFFKGLALGRGLEFLEGFDIFYSSEDEEELGEITISWSVIEPSFLTSKVSLMMPSFENVEFSMSGRKTWGAEEYYEIYLKAETYEIIESN